MLPDVVGNRVFVCVGEPSGDEFAGLIVRSYLKKNPQIKFIGVAGPTARDAGVEVLMEYDRMMVLGIQSFFRSIAGSIDVYRKIARLLYKERPDTFIGVAYPGINLLLCRYAGQLGCRTFFFMPPQIWAWGDFRKYFIRKWVDHVVSVLPFEYKYYRCRHLSVDYIKHPLAVNLLSFKRQDGQKRIGFMPGSRPGQIRRHIPVFNKLISTMRKRYDGYKYYIIMHPETSRCVETNADKIVSQDRYQAMKDCDLIMTTSGTASLEVFFLGVPQIFFHIPSFIDMHFFRHFVHTKEYNLANLYSGEKIVPTIISRDREKILREVIGLFSRTLSSAG